MAAGITARQYTNNAVFTEKTTYMLVPAVAGGASQDLVALAVSAMKSLPSSILLSNKSAATIFIKPSFMSGAGSAGEGIAISSLGSMFFPITGVPADGIYVENAADCYAICFE